MTGSAWGEFTVPVLVWEVPTGDEPYIETLTIDAYDLAFGYDGDLIRYIQDEHDIPYAWRYATIDEERKYR